MAISREGLRREVERLGRGEAFEHWVRDIVCRAESNEITSSWPAPWEVLVEALVRLERRVVELEERVAVLEGVEKVEE